MNNNLSPIDEYILAQNPEYIPLLFKVKGAIKKAVPQSKEKISWRMPTFYDEKTIIHFAAFRHHIGIFPGASAINHFEKELRPYKSSKGGIQFPYHKEIPYDLITDIATWCYENGMHHGK